MLQWILRTWNLSWSLLFYRTCVRYVLYVVVISVWLYLHSEIICSSSVFNWHNTNAFYVILWKQKWRTLRSPWIPGFDTYLKSELVKNECSTTISLDFLVEFSFPQWYFRWQHVTGLYWYCWKHMGYAINVFTVCNLFLTAQFIIKYLVMNHCKQSPVKGVNANISARKTKCIFSFCEICVVCAGFSFNHSKCTIK